MIVRFLILLWLSGCETISGPLRNGPLARNVRKVDNAIYWINHYPADSVVCFVNTYQLDNDLPGGQPYPAFEQLGLGFWNTTTLDNEISPVPVVKGVYLDASLDYNEYITKTVSNSLLKPKQMNRIEHPLDRKTLLLLMNTFIFSKLLYCMFNCLEQHQQTQYR